MIRLCSGSGPRDCRLTSEPDPFDGSFGEATDPCVGFFQERQGHLVSRLGQMTCFEEALLQLRQPRCMAKRISLERLDLEAQRPHCRVRLDGDFHGIVMSMEKLGGICVENFEARA